MSTQLVQDLLSPVNHTDIYLNTKSKSTSDYHDVSLALYRKDVCGHDLLSQDEERVHGMAVINAQKAILELLSQIPGILVNLNNTYPTGNFKDRSTIVTGFNTLRAQRMFENVTRADDHVRSVIRSYVNSQGNNAKNDSHIEAKGQLHRCLMEYRFHPKLHKYYIDKVKELSDLYRQQKLALMSVMRANQFGKEDIQAFFEQFQASKRGRSLKKVMTNAEVNKAYKTFNECALHLEKTLHADIGAITEVFKHIKPAELNLKNAISDFAGANYRLVLDYVHEFRGRGLDAIDLVQEGNIGLLKAIQSFDPFRGIRFSTHAVHWIRQSMRRAIHNTASDVRTPVGQHEKQSKIKRQLITAMNNGINKSYEEAAQELGLQTKRHEVPTYMVSLYEPRGENTVVADLLVDEEFDIDEAINTESVERVLRKAFKILNKRDRDILCMYYGILGYKESSSQEIADMYGLGTVRIHQLIREAKQFLKQNSPEIHNLWETSVLEA